MRSAPRGRQCADPGAVPECGAHLGQPPDLQESFPDVRLWDYWFWLVWHGSLDYPEIARLLYPEPPRRLMARVVGAETAPRDFLQGGILDWRRVRQSLVEGGFDFERGGRVLDFGSGCGRILRHFARYAGTCEFSGADVDEEAVAWSREHLDFGTFEPLLDQPPSPFRSSRFAAVYAFSVFSHLPERLHRRWMEGSVNRITSPGAVVVLTVQGERVIEKLVSGAVPRDHPSAAELRRDSSRIRETGFAFDPYRKLAMVHKRNEVYFEGWDLEEYGSTFILPRYIAGHWDDLFHVVEWNSAPDDWQDYVILRRLPG